MIFFTHVYTVCGAGSIEKGKLLADSLSALAGHIKGDKDGLINLQTVLQEAVRLCKMFEMLHANFVRSPPRNNALTPNSISLYLS
jgi:hypothetical protein